MPPPPIPSARARSLLGTLLGLVALAQAGCGNPDGGGTATGEGEGPAQQAFVEGKRLLEQHTASPNQTTLDAAIERLERAAELQPQSARYHYWAGRAVEWLRENERALAHYRAAAHGDPSDTDTLWRLGTLLLEDGELDQAREAFERGRDLGAAEPELFLGYGSVLELQGELEQAREAFQRAIALRPTYDDALFRLAHVLRDLGDEPGAEAALAEFEKWSAVERSLHAALKAVHADPGDVQALVEAGVLCFKLQRWDQAHAWLDRALEEDGDRARAHQHKGMLHLVQGNLDLARRHLEACVRLDPGCSEGHRELAFLRLQLGDEQGAWESISRSVETAPDDAAARFHMGVVALRLGRTAQSEAAFDAAIALDGQQVGARLGRAEVLYGSGRRAEALAEYRRVLQIDPANAGALQSVRFIQGQGNGPGDERGDGDR